MQKEKKIKKAEKALEGKVCFLVIFTFLEVTTPTISTTAARSRRHRRSDCPLSPKGQ
jgi:hypothetical protein